MFGEEHSTKRKAQTLLDYLNDVLQNEKTCRDSPMTGILSYEKVVSVENWMQNSVENLVGNTINLPVDWAQVKEISTTKE